jgi:hypothetical protein
LIAEAANRPDQGAFVANVHFATKIINIDVYDIGHSFEIELPNLLDDGCARNGLTGVAHQALQQGKFLRAESDGVSATLHGMRDAVEFEVLDVQDGAGVTLAAQDSANARGEFCEGEGLGEEIVRAGIKAPHALFDLGSSGNDEDGQIGLLRTNAPEHVQCCSAREIEVENQEVVGLIGDQPLSFGSIANHADGKLLLPKPLAEELREGRVIFRDKDTHEHTLGGKYLGRG